MKLNIFAYYNELLEAFGQPQFDDHEPEKLVPIITRDLAAKTKEGKVENLKYLKLYCLGVYDDETGAFVSNKKLLLDLGSQITAFEAQLKAKEVSNDE